MLFAFDRKRRAILLVGGDKSDDWDGWYKENIPIADSRFEAHQVRIADEQSAGRAPQRSSGTTKDKTQKGRRR